MPRALLLCAVLASAVSAPAQIKSTATRRPTTLQPAITSVVHEGRAVTQTKLYGGYTTIIQLRGRGLTGVSAVSIRRGGSPGRVLGISARPSRSQNGTSLDVTLRAAASAEPGSYSLRLTLSQQGKLGNKTVLAVPGFALRVVDSASPPGGFFRPSRPKLVVLMHGACGRPSDPPSELRGAPRTNQLAFARFYFEFDWVRHLLGGATLQPRDLYTFGGQRLDKANYVDTALQNTPQLADHFVTLRSRLVPSTRTVGARRRTGYRYDPARPPALAALLTYRDASRDIITQSEQAIAQIYQQLTTQYGYDDIPQLIFVVHSMGGNTIRTILSNPSQAIAVGNSEQPRTLSPLARRKADFIRNRTNFVVTLATPHEGSPEPDIMLDDQSFLNRPFELTGMMPQFVLGTVNAALAGASIDVQFDRQGSTLGEVLGTLGAFGFEKIENVRSRDSIHDLRTDFWANLNRNALRPQNCRRTISVDAGDSRFIPFYLVSGRTPATGFFQRPDFNQWSRAANSLGNEREFDLDATPAVAELDVFPDTRTAIETFELIALDVAVVQTSTHPRKWGTTANGQLDRIHRLEAREWMDMIKSYLERDLDRVAREFGVFDLKFDTPELVKAAAFLAGWNTLDYATKRIRLNEIAAVMGIETPAPLLSGDLPVYLRHLWQLERDSNDQPAQWTANTATVGRDGEIDNDGMVGFDSGLAFNLGHDHQDGGGWYRLGQDTRDFEPWELTNHASICTIPAVSRWLHDNLISRPVGPMPRRDSFSQYPALRGPVVNPGIATRSTRLKEQVQMASTRNAVPRVTPTPTQSTVAKKATAVARYIFVLGSGKRLPAVSYTLDSRKINYIVKTTSGSKQKLARTEVAKIETIKKR